MQAKEIMRKRVLTATPEMTLKELADFFVEHRITGAPVVGRFGRIVGVVSQTDLVRREHEAPPAGEVASYHIEPDELEIRRGFHVEAPEFSRVQDVMTPKVVTFEEDGSVAELAKLMLRRRIHRVLITRGGKLSGIVTSMDMLKAVGDGAPRANMARSSRGRAPA